MYSKNFYAIVFVIFFVFFIKLSAQSVVGTVSDSLSKNAINDALISLAGTNISTITNQNGEYLLRDIPVGEYLLEVNYFGYDSKKILVSVDSTSQIKANIQLNPSTENDGVDLLNQSKSQLEEINAQLTPVIVKEAISGNRLQNLSDENLFLTLSRVPGVFINYKQIPFIHWKKYLDYSNDPNSQSIYYYPITDEPGWKFYVRGLGPGQLNVQIDGINLLSSNAFDKSIDLSLIAQENLQNIEFLKTITSDEDGDASAGALKLVRGKALGKRKISAQMLGNYNNLEKSYNQYRFAGAYSERFLDNKLGLKIDTDIEKRINSSVYSSRSYIFYAESERDQGGANITVDYNTSDGGNLSFNGFYKKAKSNYFESTFLTQFFPVFMANYRNYRAVEREQESKIFSLIGSNYLLGFNIDWNASFSEAIAENPLDYLLSFYYHKNNSPYGKDLPYWNNSFENPTRTYSNQKNIELNISNQFRYTNDISGKIKAGYRYKETVKNHDEDSRIENASFPGNIDSYRLLADGTKVKKDYSGTRFDGLVGSRIDRIYLDYFQDDTSSVRDIFDDGSIALISQDALRQWRELNRNEYYLNNNLSINSYNYSGDISSAYLMHTLSFKNSIDFIAGIRLENENNEYVGYSFAKTKTKAYFINDTPDKSEIYSYTDLSLLPNIQMLLKPSDFFNLRLSVYKTLIRPDYYQRAPKYLACTNNNQGFLNLGNPYLENADVWNYEVQTQFYGKHIGIFSINGFFKNIDGMIQHTNGLIIGNSSHLEEIHPGLKQLAQNFQFEKYEYSYLYTYYNSSNPAKIWGFEISHKMNMYFLPGYLKNIILDYNFTFLRSETNIYKTIFNSSAEESLTLDTDVKEKLNVAPEFFANIILGYDIKGFSIRLAYVYQDNDKVVNDYFARPIIKDRYSRLDIALRQQILDFVSVKLLLNNLTDAKEEFTRELSTYHKYSEGMSINFGIQVAF